MKGCKFDLCLALKAIGQWRFFTVQHLLWHWASVYNGNLRWPVTLKPIAERLAVELSSGFTPWVCRGWDSNTQVSASRANALTDCATVAVLIHYRIFYGIGCSLVYKILLLVFRLLSWLSLPWSLMGFFFVIWWTTDISHRAMCAAHRVLTI